MGEIPNGLYDFTVNILSELDQDVVLPKIDAHDPDEEESPDFLWYKVTPHLALSDGEYMSITQEAGGYWVDFGMRGCCGGDPTWGDFDLMKATPENAKKVAADLASRFNHWK